MMVEWMVFGCLFCVVSLAIVFAIFAVRLSSKFSTAVLELARLSKAGSLREVIADDHSEDGPVFEPGIERSDDYEAELEELMVRERNIPPNERAGPRLRGEG